MNKNKMNFSGNFYSGEVAKKALEEEGEACGITGIKALVKAAQNLNFKIKLCDYQTSFDITKDKNSFVGYSSFLLGL